MEWKREEPVARPIGSGGFGAAPSSSSAAVKLGDRIVGGGPVVSLEAGDRVTHSKFGLGHRRLDIGNRRQGRCHDRFRLRGNQETALALRAGGEVVARDSSAEPLSGCGDHGLGDGWCDIAVEDTWHDVDT